MSEAATRVGSPAVIALPKTIMGHPGALWMLSMTEFWERFAFYGIRWALVLYIVDRFHGGAASGQAGATLVFGSYIALVFAASLIGGGGGR